MGCYNNLGRGDRPFPHSDNHHHRHHHGHGPGFQGPYREKDRYDEFRPYPHRPFFHNPSRFY